MIKSQSEKCLAQNESNISVGVHVGSSLIKVKDTHLMNNNQPVAEILCWRLERKITDFTILQSMNSAQIVFDTQYTIPNSQWLMHIGYTWFSMANFIIFLCFCQCLYPARDQNMFPHSTTRVTGRVDVYIVSNVDADGLVHWHQDISSHSADQASRTSQRLMG